MSRPNQNDNEKARAVLMFGATGLIGTYIVGALIQAVESGQLERLGIFTSQGTVENKGDVIESLRAKGVEIHVGDVGDKGTIRSVLEDKRHGLAFDTIVNAAGRNAILTQIPILEVAEQVSTVKRFFPSEYGTDIEYDPDTSPHEPPHQLKLKVRKYIRENIRRLSHTYLVTGPYPELWLSKPPSSAPIVGGFDVLAKKANVAYDGKGLVSFTTMEDVGKLLVAALAHPAASQNRALKVNSFTASPLEVVAEFERQTGDEKWHVEFTPREDLIRGEKEAIESGSPLATAYTLRRIWADGQTLYADRDNGKIGFEGQEATLTSQVTQAIRKQTV